MFAAAPVHAAPEFSIGAKLGFGNWTVDDNDDSDRAEGKGSMLNVQAAVQWSKAYVGLGLSGGKFNFDDHAPRQPTNHGDSTQSGEIKRGEFDLVFGYHFWDDYSLFWALKSTTEEWEDGYTLETGGLGMGIAANHALSSTWSLLWRAGLMSFNAKHDEEDIGDGGGAALEFGAVFRPLTSTTINFGLKTQTRDVKYDNDVRQKNSTTLLGAGVNHAF
jgi:hypothetical protein